MLICNKATPRRKTRPPGSTDGASEQQHHTVEGALLPANILSNHHRSKTRQNAFRDSNVAGDRRGRQE
jgi:hypothetical protein